MLAALLLTLFAGKARATELPLGAATDYFNEMAHVDDSFHDVLTNDGDEWVKAIRTVHGFCADDASAEVTVCPDMSWFKLNAEGDARWKPNEQLERIEELDDAWQHGKFDIKWVCESFKPYWRKNKLFTPTVRQITSNREIMDHLQDGGLADVVSADEALDRDTKMPAEVVAGALVKKARAGGCAWALFTADLDGIFCQCWICPSTPKTGSKSARLNATTHVTIWNRKKFLDIAKISLAMLGCIFTLTYQALLDKFRGIIGQPTLAAGFIMKKWSDSFGEVKRGLGLGWDAFLDQFWANVALGRQPQSSQARPSRATRHHFPPSATPSLAAHLLVVNQTIDAVVALHARSYNIILSRKAHYTERAELQE